MKRYLGPLFMLTTSLWADVKSTSGNIHFWPDLNSVKMTLSSANLNVDGNVITTGLNVDGSANVTTLSVNGMQFPNVNGAVGKILKLDTHGNLEWADSPDADLSNLSDASAARTNLGLEIGTHVQAFDADIVKSDEIVTISANWVNTVPWNVSEGGTGAANAIDARANLGLDNMAQQNASTVDIDGGNIDGVEIGASSQSSANVTHLMVNGDTILGDDDTDVVRGNAAGGNVWFAGNLISKNTTYSLGTASHPWQEIYAIDLVSTSDERLKKDIEPLEYGIDTVMKLNPVSYNWKNRQTSDKTLGLLAQEVENVIAEVVNTANDEIGSRGVRYSNLVPVLIKAIQDQQEVIRGQEELIEEQQEINDAYDLRLKRLESGSGSN